MTFERFALANHGAPGAINPTFSLRLSDIKQKTVSSLTLPITLLGPFAHASS